MARKKHLDAELAARQRVWEELFAAISSAVDAVGQCALDVDLLLGEISPHSPHRTPLAMIRRRLGGVCELLESLSGEGTNADLDSIRDAVRITRRDRKSTLTIVAEVCQVLALSPLLVSVAQAIHEHYDRADHELTRVERCVEHVEISNLEARYEHLAGLVYQLQFGVRDAIGVAERTGFHDAAAIETLRTNVRAVADLIEDAGENASEVRLVYEDLGKTAAVLHGETSYEFVGRLVAELEHTHRRLKDYAQRVRAHR